MTDQIEQIPPTLDRPQRRTDRDLQRAALRDLVSLASECIRSEADIEQRHKTEVQQSNEKLDKALFVTEQRAEHLKEQVRQKYQDHLQQIDQKLTEELEQTKVQDAAMRQRIDQDFEKSERELRDKLQQATWLADSVLEATHNQLRDESTKLKRDSTAHNELLDSLENRAGALMFSYGVDIARLPDVVAPADAPSDSDAELKEHRERAENLLAQLENLSAPRLMTGAKPYIVSVAVLIAAVAAAQLVNGNVPTLAQLKALNLEWRDIGIYAGIAGMSLLILGVIVRFAGKSQARKVYQPMRQAIANSRHAMKVKMDRAHEDRENRRQRANRRREMEVQAAKDKFTPNAAKLAAFREKTHATREIDHTKRLARAQQQRLDARAEMDAWQAQHTGDIQSRADHDIATAKQRHHDEIAESDRIYEQSKADLERRWKDGLARIQKPIDQHGKDGDRLTLDWNDTGWKEWQPPEKFASTVQFGELEVDLKQLTESIPGASNSRLEIPDTFSLPALLAFPSQASLLIQHDRDGRAVALQTLQMVMTRLLTTQPPGRVRFTIIDPVGLGQNFAGFMHLADWDEALVGGRIWTSSDHIEQRLANLTDHMETVIQKYLRNEFEAIDEYNAQAGELAEPYRFLVISDFPVNFTDDSIRRLNSIAASGARCGVYTLIAHDRRAPLPGGVNLDDLIAHSVNLVQEKVPTSPAASDGENGDAPLVPANGISRFVWKDEVFQQFPLAIHDSASEQRLTEILTEVGQAAKDANRVEVSFQTIAPDDEEFFSEHADNDLHVAIGRMGATRLQMFRLGRGVAQHALVAGKTGSGKSTLLHALVTNLAMWYSPDEIEFYLVDFKKGVEFKTYATHQLPHARAIAVESDREFGLSVLQRIDAELTRRGELFRKAGVQDLASYRQTIKSDAAPKRPSDEGEDRDEASSLPSSLRRSVGSSLPRTLLIIDEFQEFFSEDDKLAQDAAVLLDRLVRQGRAFGIHVLLGSQTIGGSAGLARSTIGQMAVRIALQTTEADSQLILGDNNSAARLLSRPGEAIYNDQGGLVEANSPFQVAWLPDEQREVYLTRVFDRAKAEGKTHDPAAVFEGNAPADIRKNRRLARLLGLDGEGEAPSEPLSRSTRDKQSGSGSASPSQMREREGEAPSEPSVPSEKAARTEPRPPVARLSGPPLAWVGDPVAIKEPTAIAIRRQSGSNVIIIGQQEESAMALTIAMMISLSAQHAKDGCRFVLLDGTPADSHLSGVLPSIANVLPNQTQVVEYRAVPEAIAEVHAEMQRRLADHITDAPAIYVVIYGLQRYRALRKSEEGFAFSMSDEEKKPQPDEQFAELLREGPPLGIHVITWCDTPAAVERTLERSSMREFDHRILFQMSANDSSNLIDSPAANKLGFYRAIAFSEEQGVLEKFRPYAMPEKRWLARITELLKR